MEKFPGNNELETALKVVILIRGGVAEVMKKPLGVAVEIRDYDTEGVPSENLEGDGALVNAIGSDVEV